MNTQRGSTISLQLPAEPRSVATARHALQRFAADTGVDVEAVALAVSEAVTNAVRHAYSADGEIVVRALVNDVLRVIVSDRGAGFAPRPRDGGLHLGLALISQVADAVEIAAGSDGVEIEMRFARTA